MLPPAALAICAAVAIRRSCFSLTLYVFLEPLAHLTVAQPSLSSSSTTSPTAFAPPLVLPPSWSPQDLR